MHVSVSSRNPKLGSISAGGLFIHFCRNGGDHPNAKVKLSCSGVLIRRRKNGVKTCSGGGFKDPKTAF